MSFVLTWPKRRRLTGRRDLGDGQTAPALWSIEVEPGRLTSWTADGTVVHFTDRDELRAYAIALYCAAMDLDLETQDTAAKASWARRARQLLPGNRHRPVIERPEPPAHMEVSA